MHLCFDQISPFKDRVIDEIETRPADMLTLRESAARFCETSVAILDDVMSSAQCLDAMAIP